MNNLNYVKYFKSSRCKYLLSSEREYVAEDALHSCRVATATDRIKREQLVINDAISLEWLYNCTIHSSPKTDVVYSQEKKFVYVDVTKAGSASIRRALAQNGDRWWDKSYGNKEKRSTTKLVEPENQKEYFIWSIVRDPIARFLSSVQQAMEMSICKKIGLGFSKSDLHPENNENYRQYQQECFDEFIRQLMEGKINNEHTDSQVRRLSGLDHLHQSMNYTFIGKLEDMNQVWPLVYRHLYPESSSITVLPHIPHTGPPLSLNIEGWHIRALCSLYSQDFICFNYEFP